MEATEGAGAWEGGAVGGGAAVAPAAAAAAADAAPAGGGGGKVHVLVVDDSPVDRKIVERLLLRSGNMFEVTAVDGGKKALEALGLNETAGDDPGAVSDCDIDVILSDYCMPEMDGYDLLKAVKENEVRRSIPVVIMSSENDPQRISRCMELGAEDFIPKPLQAVHIQQLRSYARPPSSSAAKTGGKRKLPADVVTESEGTERRPRPRLTGVTVA